MNNKNMKFETRLASLTRRKKAIRNCPLKNMSALALSVILIMFYKIISKFYKILSKFYKFLSKFYKFLLNTYVIAKLQYYKILLK